MPKVAADDVRAHVGVKVDRDRADVVGADRREREEALRPATVQHDALVQRQQVGDDAGRRGRHREQRTREVAADRHVPVDGRVDAVVVARRQVQHAVVHAARRLRLERVDRAAQEARHGIRDALDVLDAVANDLAHHQHARVDGRRLPPEW